MDAERPPEEDLETALAERDRALAELEAMRSMSALQRRRYDERLEEDERLRAELRLAERDRDRALADLERLGAHPIVRIARLGTRLGRATSRAVRGVGAPKEVPATPSAIAGDGTLAPLDLARRPVTREAAQVVASLPAEAVDAADARIVVAVHGADAGAEADAIARRLRLPVRPAVEVHLVQPDADIGAALAGTDAPWLLWVSAAAEPLDDAWLDRLVAGLRRTGAAAAGPRLVAPAGTGDQVTLAARGLDVTLERGMPLAVAIGPGSDPAAAAVAADAEVAALPGDAVLLDLDAMTALGGLTAEALRDPVELAARIRDAGRSVVLVDDSVVRITPAERSEEGDDPVPARPAAARRALLDALGPADRRSGRAARIAVIRAPGDRAGTPRTTALVRGFVNLGLDAHAVTAPPGEDLASRFRPSDDVAVLVGPGVHRRRLPDHLVTVALVEGDVDRWLDDPAFDDIDVVFAAPGAAGDRIGRDTTHAVEPAADVDAPAILDALLAWARRPRMSIHIGPLTWTAAAKWGDVAFGRDLQRALRRQGWGATVLVYEERDGAVAGRADVALHVFGARAPRPRPGQTSVLWVISHPDRITWRLADAYPLVFAGSDLFAAQLAERSTARVVALHQATDPERFYPDPTGPEHELLFVGNSRGVRRRILADLAGTTHEVGVYGGGWTPKLLAPHRLAGTWIPNEQLRRWYSSAGIVLCDHYDEMRDDGFISNRAYDALACGAFLISDRVPGIEAEFGEGLVTYADRDELQALVDAYLADPERRRREAAVGRETVLAQHTFAHRVTTILDEVARLAGNPASADAG